MTTDKHSNALYLAGELEKIITISLRRDLEPTLQAAYELRRLYYANNELLEALSGLVGCIDHGSQNPTQKLEVARAAIAKATGETK